MTVERKREAERGGRGEREWEGERERGGEENKSNPRDNGDRSVGFFSPATYGFLPPFIARSRSFSAMIIRLIIYSADKSDRQPSNATAATDIYASFLRDAQII